MGEFKPTVKRSIRPVTLTVTVEATRVNENGTFSGFVIKSAKGPNATFKAVSPPQGGGAIYLKVESLEGVSVQTGAEATAREKIKLF
jgi:hypothetical protein